MQHYNILIIKPKDDTKDDLYTLNKDNDIDNNIDNNTSFNDLIINNPFKYVHLPKDNIGKFFNDYFKLNDDTLSQNFSNYLYNSFCNEPWFHNSYFVLIKTKDLLKFQLIIFFNLKDNALSSFADFCDYLNDLNFKTPILNTSISLIKTTKFFKTKYVLNNKESLSNDVLNWIKQPVFNEFLNGLNQLEKKSKQDANFKISIDSFFMLNFNEPIESVIQNYNPYLFFNTNRCIIRYNNNLYLYKPPFYPTAKKWISYDLSFLNKEEKDLPKCFKEDFYEVFYCNFETSQQFSKMPAYKLVSNTIINQHKQEPNVAPLWFSEMNILETINKSTLDKIKLIPKTEKIRFENLNLDLLKVPLSNVLKNFANFINIDMKDLSKSILSNNFLYLKNRNYNTTDGKYLDPLLTSSPYKTSQNHTFVWNKLDDIKARIVCAYSSRSKYLEMVASSNLNLLKTYQITKDVLPLNFLSFYYYDVFYEDHYDNIEFLKTMCDNSLLVKNTYSKSLSMYLGSVYNTIFFFDKPIFKNNLTYLYELVKNGWVMSGDLNIYFDKNDVMYLAKLERSKLINLMDKKHHSYEIIFDIIVSSKYDKLKIKLTKGDKMLVFSISNILFKDLKTLKQNKKEQKEQNQQTKPKQNILNSNPFKTDSSNTSNKRIRR